jgi:type II secretory pathway component PulF
MPLLFTPGQFSRRAELYHQLHSLTGAGVGLIQALEQLQKHPPSPSFRAPLQGVIADLNAGATFSEAVLRRGSWTTAFDTALLEAGERSGRLEQAFKLLSDYYTERALVARRLLTDLAYPVFVLHFAVFILPFAEFFKTGDTRMYLLKTFGVLLPLYGLVALGIFAAQGRHGEPWRAFMEGLMRWIPGLGAGRRDLALARLAAALEALLSAGVGVIEAWDLAARASGSPALARRVAVWKPRLAAGLTPAELVRESGRFPELFANQYTTGEISGKLDETLRRLHRYYQEEGSRKLQTLAQWAPKLFYLVVAGLIAWRVVSFYLGYFQQVGAAGGF